MQKSLTRFWFIMRGNSLGIDAVGVFLLDWSLRIRLIANNGGVRRGLV
jgi:hypothetical protein